MKQVNYVVERYGNSSMVQEVGLDNAIWKFTTTLGQRLTTVGTIVYVGCFILTWWILEKITAEGRKNTERMRKSLVYIEVAVAVLLGKHFISVGIYCCFSKQTAYNLSRNILLLSTVIERVLSMPITK